MIILSILLYYTYSTSAQKNRKRVKRVKREKGLQSPPEYADYPKTVIVVAEDAAVEVVANRGTADNRIEAPGTAPRNFRCLILLFFALFYLLIVFAPIILTPLPDISVHII